MRFAQSVPNLSPILDKNCAPMGPEILSKIGAGVWRNRSGAFPDSNSLLDEYLSVTNGLALPVYQGKQNMKQHRDCVSTESHTISLDKPTEAPDMEIPDILGKIRRFHSLTPPPKGKVPPKIHKVVFLGYFYNLSVFFPYYRWQRQGGQF